MRQILYVSKSVTPAALTPLADILQQSRNNNALDGVTGLLWSDGDRFAQVLEGDERAVAEAMTRIRADTRHHDVVVLHDREIEQRQFGSWSMELREAGAASDRFDARMRRVLDDASDAIRAVFASLISPSAA